MNYAQLVNALETALAPLVVADGGELVVAQSLEKAHAYLTQAPNRWRLVLHWEGFAEHPLGREGMTTHQVATVLQQGADLIHRPGENLTKPLPSGALPFSTRIDRVIEWMGSLRFPNGTGADVAGFSMAGSQWLEAAPRTQAHVLNWRLDAALPPHTTNRPLVFPHLP